VPFLTSFVAIFGLLNTGGVYILLKNNPPPLFLKQFFPCIGEINIFGEKVSKRTKNYYFPPRALKIYTSELQQRKLFKINVMLTLIFTVQVGEQ